MTIVFRKFSLGTQCNSLYKLLVLNDAMLDSSIHFLVRIELSESTNLR